MTTNDVETNDGQRAETEDALFVLTAVLLTPAQFPSVLGDDYPEACDALGLAPRPDGYGLVLGQDQDGARWTVVTEDVTLVACAVAAWDCGMEYDLSPNERTVTGTLPGWPLAVAVSTPGVPPPHDPPPETDPWGEPLHVLTPPNAEVWGPEQRRLGADEIALQWASWRAQVETDDVTLVQPDPEPADPEAAGPDAALVDSPVRKVLRELAGYLDAPPPPGRIRSAFASEDSRTLRIDGPGWSVVARTDDIAFVLLDDEPGEVLPVGRGPQLPMLLRSLDDIAVRPAA
ncbi:hypothetical protein [Streptomyces oceani]|uniref:Integral membrane protein n=1 Tax=Streptomyces oceani TaxID=1075402 RepID=A0A1E7JY73_9ACTN|nr:hypothetical protein [Streptomyces oceani]OEU96614.1 hypothetical protein AN216_19310 [Streptomyces oceani]